MDRSILDNILNIVNKGDRVSKDDLINKIKSIDSSLLVMRLADYSNDLLNSLDEKDILIVIDNIVDIDDAYINSIAFLRDRGHKRFYTVNEVVDKFRPNYRLLYFLTIYPEDIECDLSANNILKDAVLNISDKIKNRVSLVVDKGIAQLSLPQGIYIFERL